ncbi:hypothetical protein GX50_06118 [[Emmonsia] crescens]|uniref:Uncharacterized protein n=1 Tax=[Emmonsia] crescens TaxID=73230 RepID=A0A2B7ZD61_9EURO|nr:hypothetical protein GX50_06118 [Emmonsia crescens]
MTGPLFANTSKTIGFAPSQQGCFTIELADPTRTQAQSRRRGIHRTTGHYREDISPVLKAPAQE